MTQSVIAPGSVLGIVGGGQLGRMIALAAANHGLKVHVYAPDADSPAFDVAARTTCAAIPRATAEVLARHTPVHPNADALATTQDRLSEKAFINGLGIPTAPFLAVDTPDDLSRALETIGLPAVLKTRRFGYDGKGQRIIREPGEGDRNAIFAEFGGAPLILEGFVPFEREVSVVAARGADGSFAAFDLCENEHRNHILAFTRVPARGVAPETAQEAFRIARTIADALDYVGVLAVEMFLVREGGERLVVNEIAPRVHNSGHWTIEGALTSQFEQHVRAVCGWPLGDASRVGGLPSEMENLIGDQVEAWREILAEPGAHLHLYGKGEARPGRKMGHVTRLKGR